MQRRSSSAVLVGPFLVLALAACGGGSEPVPSDNFPAMKATASPSPALVAGDGPRGSRTVQGTGFEVEAPSAFQRRDETSAGQPKLVLERPSSVPALPSRVVVLREEDPKNDVVAQSYSLEVMQRTVQGATDIRRSDVEWPGTQRAVLVQWTQPVKIDSGEAVQTQYWQLNLQVDPQLILVVVGLSPVKDFASSGVAEVMRTIRPGN